MLEKLRKERGEEGFTLIELLVVIIIIGILAAIAIPVFLNQRAKGWDAAVKADLRNAATAQETYLTENATYTTNMVALQSMGFKYSDAKNYSSGAVITPMVTGGISYCLGATANGGTAFKYSARTGCRRAPAPNP